MEKSEEIKRRIFIQEISNLRKLFPEHAKELDKCIYDVLQKNECCDQEGCGCQMSFEQFHTTTNKMYKVSFN
jgi:hypothetical protein